MRFITLSSGVGNTGGFFINVQKREKKRALRLYNYSYVLNNQ
nr:MAG TPA_asm: hypothetical protein [Caudoviricetes sp.]